MIHYHGGPITPMPVAVEVWTGRHAMVSFAYPSQVKIAAEVCQSFVLDNGAFTTWKSGGGRVDWRAYLEWVETWRQHPGFDWCLIPDIIDGSEDENNLLCEQWPLQAHCSVPVWHLHESLERLEWLMDEWPRVALGSSGDWSTPGTKLWWLRMAEAMSVACDELGRPKAKLHGLRMLDPTIFSHLPIASGDSTNAAQNHGKETKWSGPYVPLDEPTRGLVLARRIESHASASRWNGETCGIQKNLELVG
jgi:hypothetical protein